MDHIRLAHNSDWPRIFCFFIFITIPTITISSVHRSRSLYAIAMKTWDSWDAFNTFTTQSMFGNENIRINGSISPIDFFRVENCLSWYKLRQQLVDDTNQNLRVVLPILIIALLELVWSLTTICWNFALG